MSDSSAVPTVQALLARLEEREGLIMQLKSEIDTLKAKVAILEVRLGKNSQNSSKPPSTDAFLKLRRGLCAGPRAGLRAKSPEMLVCP